MAVVRKIPTDDETALDAQERGSPLNKGEADLQLGRRRGPIPSLALMLLVAAAIILCCPTAGKGLLESMTAPESAPEIPDGATNSASALETHSEPTAERLLTEEEEEEEKEEEDEEVSGSDVLDEGMGEDEEDEDIDTELDGSKSAFHASLLSDSGRCPSTSTSGPRAIFGNPQPSPGCSAKAIGVSLCKGRQVFMRSVNVWDSQMNITVKRRYAIVVPHSVCNLSAGEPVPLMFWFHGQYGSGTDEAAGFTTSTGYRSCSHDHGWISVFPMGLGLMSDAKALNISNPKTYNFSAYNNGQTAATLDLGTGWNVGTGGDSKTCLTESSQKGAFKDVSATEYSCYASCQIKGQCGRCNWSTCHDDIAFVKTMISVLRRKYCIDMSRIYAGGQSNGGMFTHYLSQALPGVFAAVNPIYGLPLTGYAAGRDGELFRNQRLIAETSIIEFHGRDDKIIPVAGGPSTLDQWSWYYTSLEEMMSLWASLHGCQKKTRDVTNKIKKACPHIAANVECWEHQKCGTKRRVVHCLYDGHHGDLPGQKFFGCASVWFFNQFRRTSPVR